MTMSKLGKLLKERGLTGTHASGAVRHYLNTGYPPLNEIISGDPDKGLPSGQVVMIAGPSASGKTMIATQLMISAQQQGGYAAFFDYETQYHLDLAKQQGLDDHEDKYIYFKPDTFEEGIGKAIALGKLIRDEEIIPEDKPIVMVFDSLHAMTPQSKYDSLLGKGGVVEKGGKASMHDNYALSAACSAWFAVIQREFDKYGITGIFLNQVRKKTNPANPAIFTYTFPGGDAAYYYCSTIIVLTAQNIFEGAGDKKKLVYKDIKAYMEKSRNTAPYQNVHYDFVINDDKTGNFDVIGSYVKYLLKVGVIEMSGAWIKFNGKTFQGSEKVAAHYRSKRDGLAELVRLHKDFKAASEVEKGTLADDDSGDKTE